MKRFFAIASLYLAIAVVSNAQSGNFCPAPFQRSFLLGAAHAYGYDGVFYSSTVTITSLEEGGSTFFFQFQPKNSDRAGISIVPITVMGGNTFTRPDVLAWWGQEGSGVLWVCAESNLLFTMRTTRSSDCGFVGQIEQPHSIEEAIPESKSGSLIGIEETLDSWTNVGLLNAGEGESKVEIEFFSATNQSLGTIERSLPPTWNTQVDRVLTTIGAAHQRDVRAVIRVTKGAVFAWASTVNGPAGDFDTQIARR